MARCKNVGGALAGDLGGDGGDDRPCRLTGAEKGKKVVTKKRKIVDRDTKIARAVVAELRQSRQVVVEALLGLGLSFHLHSGMLFFSWNNSMVLL